MVEVGEKSSLDVKKPRSERNNSLSVQPPEGTGTAASHRSSMLSPQSWSWALNSPVSKRQWPSWEPASASRFYRRNLSHLARGGNTQWPGMPAWPQCCTLSENTESKRTCSSSLSRTSAYYCPWHHSHSATFPFHSLKTIDLNFGHDLGSTGSRESLLMWLGTKMKSWI